MYLLKPGSVPLWHLIMSYSHSTMHLLKLDERIEELVEKKFTFHHVSIKTIRSASTGVSRNLFTFHHVSIKTVVKQYLQVK